MTFPMTTPRQTEDRSAKIRAAALAVRASQAGRHTTRDLSRSTIDNRRLSLPWLTVYVVKKTYRGRWQDSFSTSLRFHFNTAAKEAIFRGGEAERTLYLSVDHARRELLALDAKGGWPLRVSRSPSSSGTSQRTVAALLDKHGYLLDDETTYFPIRVTPVGLIADLSTPYSKDDAVYHEEDLRWADRKRSSVTYLRPVSSPRSTT